MRNRLLIILMVLPSFFFAQSQTDLLNKEKDLTFKEIQKKYQDYCKNNGIVNGKREFNGEMIKEPGWKQFKRWEYYWESRVDASTGDFPEGVKLNEIRKANKSRSNNGNWTSMGPSYSSGGYAGIGRVNCVAFHPTDNNTFWVGTPAGGLWQTTNNGSTWTPLTDNNEVLGVSAIAVTSDYATSQTIYIATGDREGGSLPGIGSGGAGDNNSIGVLKSTDGGQTWNETGLSYNVSDKNILGTLIIHPNDNNTLFAGGYDGILKTTDGGATWSNLWSGAYIIDMEFKPDDPSTIYASTKEYSNAPKILKSTDNGGSWSAIKTFSYSDLRVEIAVTPDDPNYIYTIVAKNNRGLRGIFRSTNEGSSFTQLVNGDDPNKAYLGHFGNGSGGNVGQGNYDLCIAASPTDKDIVLIGGVNTWKSTNGGDNWNICNMWTSGGYYNPTGAPTVHADHHTLAFRSDGTLFEGNDGGIYKSTNNGTSWSHISGNLTISQMYRLGVSQTSSGTVITGLQDNGTKIINNGSWVDGTGGDGMECLIDFTDKDVQYSTYVYGEIYRTTNNWSWGMTTISDNIPGGAAGAWVTPYVIDPNDNQTLYVGYSDVWKTTNRGNSFTKISTINTSDKIRSMAVAPSNSDVIYVADYDDIWKTTNGGGSWSRIVSNLPVYSNKITYIAVKHDDPNTVWVSLGNYNDKRVFESTTGGAGWTNISAGLPNIPVMTITQNKQSTSVTHLYAGTDVGVYIKRGENDWELFSEGMPNVVVTELDIYYDNTNTENSRLRAATFGRGLWESDLYPSEVLAPVADFEAVNTSVVEGLSTHFNDLSEYEPTEWSWTFEGGDPATSNEQNPVVTYNAPGTYSVTLVATNEIGSNTKTKTNYITVTPAVTPIADFTVASTTVYQGQIVKFSDISENYPTAWEWTISQATPTTPSEQNPSVIYQTPGTYDVTLTVTNNAGTDTETKTSYITVEQAQSFPPVTNLTAELQGESDALLNWNLMASMSNMSEGFEGAWLANGWNLKKSATAFGELINATGTTWEQADESSFGGTHPEYIHSGTFSAGISESATNFNWLISPQITVTGSTSFSFWLWYRNSGTYETFFHIYVKDDGVWKSIKDYGESSASNEYASIEEIDLSSYASKDIQIAFVYEASENGSKLFIDDVSMTNVFVPNPADSYSIYKNDELLTTVDDSYETTYVDKNLSSGIHEYYVIANYTNPEGSSEPSNVATVEKVSDPIANFYAYPTSGEYPLSVNFYNNSEEANGYSWDFGDGTTSDEATPSHTFENRGQYSVSLTATNAYASDTETKTSYITVTDKDVVANFSATPVSGESPLTVVFTNSSTGATDYSWSFGDGNGGTEENPTHIYNTDGTYTVSLTASNLDFEKTRTKKDLIVVTPVSIPEEWKDKLSVYPNPAKDFVYVKFVNEKQEKTIVELYDFSGKVVFKSYPTSEININTRFNVSDLTSGNYFVHIQNGSEIIFVKVVVE